MDVRIKIVISVGCMLGGLCASGCSASEGESDGHADVADPAQTETGDADVLVEDSSRFDDTRGADSVLDDGGSGDAASSSDASDGSDASDSSVTVRTAASCARDDVQKQVDLASDGEVVAVPACSKTSWSTYVQITGKAITVRGAGIDKTNIVLPVGGSMLFYVPSSNTKPVKITGFTFSSSVGFSCPYVAPAYACSPIFIAGGNGFRVYSNKFSHVPSGVGASIYAEKGTYGLVDSNVFEDTFVAVYPYGDDAVGWSSDTNLGDEKAVYVEDNTITNLTQSHCVGIEGENGAKYVFRYNTVKGCEGAGSHSVCQSGGRGTRRTEVYHNTIEAVATLPVKWVGIYIMGGTGVMFQNRILGPWEHPMLFDYKRTCNASDCISTYAKRCDGTSSLDGNTPGKMGWPCLDQVGRGKGQASEPYYEWNNCTKLVTCAEDKVCDCGGASAHPWVDGARCSSPSLADHMQSGRDYFTGTVKSGYVPLAYPHPAR